MKKSLKNVVCLLALVAITAPSFAAITSSAHDFSGATWNTTDQDICGVCHTPHGGAAVTGAPLWGHDQITGSGYSMYVGTDMDWGTAPTAPDGTSLLCLSCHDGTLPLDTGGAATTMTTVNADAVVGPDLTGSHPVSFVYDTSAAADTEIKTADATINGWLDGGAGGKVQCSSCHDVHNTAAVAGLLRIANTNSDLCLTCHDK
ncbi:MAG: cytochrome c3 family protein [Anaerohalosphaeraceae bacterium]